MIIDPAPTHEEISRRVGITREQVTRVMREYTKAGLIEPTRKSWVVKDVRAVRERAPKL